MPLYRDLGLELRTNMLPNETLYQWGWGEAIYFYAGKRPFVKYLHTTSPVTPSYIDEQYATTMQQVIDHPPDFVFVGLYEGKVPEKLVNFFNDNYAYFQNPSLSQVYLLAARHGTSIEHKMLARP